MARDLTQVTATGDVVTAVPAYLRSVVLTPAAAVSTLEVRDGSGGVVRLKLQAAANGNSAVWRAGSKQGVQFSSSIHATLSGAGAVADFEFD